MSLKSCAAKAGNLLSQENREQLFDLADRLQASGLSVSKAERLAVRQLRSQLEALKAQIEEGEGDDILLSKKRGQDPAVGDRTDVSRLPKGREIPESAAVGSLEESLTLARSKSYARGRDLKMDVQERVLSAAKAAKVDLSARTKATHKFLADMVVADAQYALQSNENAVGWYDIKVSRAIGALSTVHPEIDTDQRSRLAFLWALATTSNGLKVGMNFTLAEKAYRQWKESGTMPSDVGIGNAAGAINDTLDLFNELVQKVGSERLAKFVSTEFTVGEIERMLGHTVTGEWKSTPVRGAALLGPKIGNGFFSNLNGYFDSLTMDRWLMRTWGRLTGTLVHVDPAEVARSRRGLQSAVSSMTDSERRVIAKVVGAPVRKDLTRAELDALAISSQKASMKKDKREVMASTGAMNSFRKAANNHQKMLDGQKEAPEGPGERNWIRAVFHTALEGLRADGKAMTMSDLQALLWYPERRLYDAAKSDEDVEDGYEDDEAPDYANAARDLAVANGVKREDVEKAMDKAEARGTIKGQPLSDAEKKAMMEEFRAPPAQAVNLAFEVAPDPNDEELTAQWGELSTKERGQITQDVRDAVLQDVVDAVGVTVTKTVGAIGGYAGNVNPNLITEYKVTKVSLDEARALAAAIGMALDQDSVALVDPRVEDTVGIVRVTLSQKAEKHADRLYSLIHAAIPEIDGFTARGNNFDILNFTGLANDELAGKIDQALEALEDVDYQVSFGDTHSELITKDTYEARTSEARPGSGEEIRERIAGARDRARALVAQGIADARAGRAGTGERAAAARRADARGDEGSGEEVTRGFGAAFDLHRAKSARGNTGYDPDTGEALFSTSRNVTEMPAFKKWFGDSKVVDKGGKPLVVYHGTPDGDTLQFKDNGLGIFFTSSAKVADGYTMRRGMWRSPGEGASIVPAYLSMRNPLEIDALGKRSDNIPVPWQEWKPKVFGNLPANAVNVQAALNHAREKGHDGLIVRNVVDTAAVEDKYKSDVYAVLKPEQVKSAVGNTGEFDASNDDITRSTRRDFLIATAAALAAPEVQAGVTLGRAKPLNEQAANSRVSPEVEKILTGNGRGTTNIEGYKALRQAMDKIAATGPTELRALAGNISKLLPTDTLMLSVEGKDMNAHGVVEFSPVIRMRLFDGPQKISQGLRHSTLLHESLHTAVLARYRTLSSGVLRSNDAKLGMSAPAAAKAMEQFRGVWEEFGQVARPALRGMDTNSGLGLSIEEAMGDPDEFFVRALTQPELQSWMAKQEYEGKTLLQKFIDWVKSSLLGFKKEGTAPSWLDAALLASDDLLKAMGGDPADFKRLRASNALAERSRSKQETITRSAPRDQAETPEFKRWFKDSKVVDAKGEPMVVYHGTNKDFESFDTQRGGELGSHFGTVDQAEKVTHYWQAKRRPAGINIMPVYLSIQNPLRLRDYGHFGSRAVGVQLVSLGIVKKPPASIDDVVTAIKAAGYDGVVYGNTREGEGDSWIALDPEQIKSAIGNNGEFDPESGDITRSTSRLGSIRDMSAGFGYKVADWMDSSKNVSWWDKSVGTPYHLAQKHPMFKRVFDGLQNSIADVSKYATRAADLAPSILPKLENMKDLFKSPLSAEDVEKLADPIFKGTLTYTRDAEGEVVEAETVGDAGIVWTDKELTDMWHLDERQRGLYREFRKATNKSIADLAITNMVRYAGEDAEGVRGRVLEQTQVKAAAELLADHLATLAATDTKRADSLQNAARVIKQMADDARGLMAKGYAPLSRFGDYAVYAPGIGEHGFFEMFENERDANRRKRQLETEFPKETVTVGTIAKEVHQLFKGITPETLALFGDALGLEESANDQQSQVFQEYLRLAKSTRSALKHLIERKGVEGYSNDVGRVLAAFVYSNGRAASQNLNARDITKALFDLKESKQGDLFDHAMKLSQYAQNPQEEAQTLRGLTFLSFIGWNLASSAVNLTQSATTTLPTLGMHFGIAKAAKAMGSALGVMKNGAGADQDLEHALKRAALDGVTDPNETHYLQGQAQGSGTLKSGDGTKLGDTLAKMSNGMSKLLFIGGKAFGLAEVMNRKIAFISAYSLARANPEKFGDPYAFAVKLVDDTQFLQNKANNSAWARGPIGAVAMQFKKFGIAYVENLVRMWGNGSAGKIAVAQSLAILWLMAGLGGMPGGDDLDDFLDGIMQRVLNKSFSSKQAKKEFFAGILGDAGAEFVLNGISGLPGMPIDVSGRLGMGNLIPATGLAVVKQNYGRDVQELFGAAGAMTGRALEGANALTKGNVGAAVEGVLPTAMANVVKAVDMATMSQYRDSHGRKVVDTTMAEAIMKGIGFQPASVKNVQDATRTQQELIALNKQRETEIADLWARGRIERKPELVDKAKQQLKDWNAQNGASPIEISPSQINKRVVEANMSKAQRLAKTAPKEMRASVKAELTREIGE